MQVRGRVDRARRVTARTVLDAVLSHPARSRQPPSGLQVMVVDDNPANLSAACELLSGWGITPVLATDGTEAVAVARER
jgi:PleD family two-component response regulator